MDQVLTIIEASVEESNWNLLKDKYISVDRKALPPSLLNSQLIQDVSNPKIWRIVTTWESLQAMNTYRQSVDTPAWLLVFQSVGAQPKLVVTSIRVSK